MSWNIRFVQFKRTVEQMCPSIARNLANFIEVAVMLMWFMSRREKRERKS